MSKEIDLLSAQVDLMRTMNSLLTEQSETLKALAGVQGQQSQASQEAAEALELHNEQLKETTHAAEEATPKVSSFNDMLTSAADKIKSFVGEGIFESFSNGINLLGINFSSLANIISNPVSAAMGFLGSIWDTITRKAAEVYQELLRMAEAMEKVREKFGSFNENTSRRTITAYKNLGSTIRTTTENSAQFGRKFAPGFEGAQQRLDKVLGIVEDLGPTIDLLGQQFNDAADQMFLLKDGLNFSGEALQQTAVLSQLAGKSLKGFSEEIMTTVNKIGKQFGISTKVLGADVGKALTNFKMLGRMTGDYVKEITKAAVFTRKLGIEITELTGLVDKFDEFEGGAEAAAQLAQGFGMVLDPLKMMGMEVGPRLQEMQRAFMATGRSIESMSRQERKLLADTAGLTEQQAFLAFSSKGMSMSYDEIASGAEGATKKQKSMDQIMNEVLDNIPNIITGFKSATGFIEAFFEGFGVGFGGKMLPTLIEVAQEMGKTFGIGIRVGRQFFDIIFPKDADGKASPMLRSITSVAKMFTGIAGVIEDFMSVWASMEPGADVSDLISNAIGGIFTTIKETFLGVDEKINFGEIVTKIGKFLVETVLGAVKWMTGPNGLASIATSMRDVFKPKGDGKDPTNSLFAGLKESMKNLIKELPKLIPLIVDLGLAFVEMIGQMFEELPLADLFVAGGPVAIALGGVVTNVMDMLGNLFGGSGTAAPAGLTEASAKMNMSMGSGISSAVTTVVEGAGSFMTKLGDILLEAGKFATMALAIGEGIKIIGAAVHDVLITFLEPQQGQEKSFVEMFADAAFKFEGLKPESITAVGAMLAGIMLAVGALTAGLIVVAGNLPVDIDSVLKVLMGAGVGVMLTELLKTFALAIQTILTDMVKAFGSDDFLGAAKKLEGLKFDGVIEAFNIITKFAAALPSFESLNIDPDAIIKKVKSVTQTLMGTETEKDGLIQLFSGVSLGEAFKLSMVQTALDPMKNVMATMGQVIKSVNEIIGVDAAKLNIDKLIADDGIMPSLKKFGTQLNEVSAALGDTAAKSIADISKSITDLGVIITSLTTLPDTVPAISKITTLIGAAGLAGVGGTVGLLPELKKLGKSFNDSFSGESAISEPVYESVDNLSRAVRIVGRMTEGLEDITGFADSVETITKSLTDAKMMEFETRLVAIVEHVRMVNEALNNLDKVNINTTIDRLGTNMKAARSVMQINGGAVNVNVQLNVTMNAEKLAGQLVLGGYLAGSKEFNEYLQNDTDTTFDGLSAENKKGYYREGTTVAKQALE